MHLSRHLKAVFLSHRALRPGDGKSWTKPLRGRFQELSIGNCHGRVRQVATRLNTNRSFF
jgi:hypothetical protein